MFSLENIERYLFRPLFVFFTFIVVLLAIVQASGRFTMLVLDGFEDEVNAFLAQRQIVVSGLQGDWRGLNPVVRVAGLTFPAGSLKDIEIELDLLESTFRSNLILRVAQVSNAQVHAVQGDDGWRLRDMQNQGNDIDVVELLRHSDDISGYLQLYLHGASGEMSEIAMDVAVHNTAGGHYAGLTVDNVGSADPTFEVQLWQRDEVAMMQRAQTAGRVAGTLSVPAVLSGMAALKFNFSETQWQDLDAQGAGILALAVSGIRMPQTKADLAVNLHLKASRSQQLLQVVSDQLALQGPDEKLELGPLYVTAQLPSAEQNQLEAAAELLASTPPEPLVGAWLEQLDLGQISDFLGRHLAGWDPAASWIKALAVNGQASNVHGFYDPELGAGYVASLSELSLQGYKGVPSLANIQGRLWGHANGMAVQINSTDIDVQFPDLYDHGWHASAVQGVLKGWFSKTYFGLRGSHIKADIGDTDVAGGFAITRPPERAEQRLSLELSVDDIGLIQAKSFVPTKLPAGLSQWLENGPRGGHLSDVQFVLHGQTKVEPGTLGRRLELDGTVTNGKVEYAPGWPEVAGLNARVHVAGVNTRIDVAAATTLDIKLGRANIELRDNSRYVAGSLSTRTNADSALALIRTSPLQDILSFVTPQWRGSGAIDVRADLLIPINTEEAPPLKVDLEFSLDDFGLDMPEYRVAVAAMQGEGTFSLPHHLAGDFVGTMFNNSATFHAHSDQDWLRFEIGGVATPTDIYALLESEDQVPIDGSFAFASTLNLAMSGGITSLVSTSDLVGLEIRLPGQFAKTADLVSRSEVDLQFLPDYQSVRYQYQNANGWLHYGDGIERGALGISMPPPMTAEDERAIVISGHLPELVLGDWVSDDGESAVSLPVDWKLQNVAVDKFVIDELTFEALTLNGGQRGGDVNFIFDGPTLRGTATLPEDAILLLDLDFLQLPATEKAASVEVDPNSFESSIGYVELPKREPQIDPISVAVGRTLPAANVAIAQLQLGNEPFGSWRFIMQPEADQIVFSPFSADVNGVHIQDSYLAWDLDKDQTTFKGDIKLDDLGETLPKWDYAASLTTDKASASAAVNWTGSPLNVGLLNTNGDVEFAASDGRFIDVEAGGGGLRILGLLNFAKVAKRINFDISDVTGEGVSFDKIEGMVELHSGQLTFPERMTVDSSSGKFQLGGLVDLDKGQLDNELVVTLPVSRSLPWYGVYLALANPLAGLGVMVGERVLRRPIEQFSSLKYAVNGSWDDPEIKFISLWDRSIKDADLADEASLVDSTP